MVNGVNREEIPLNARVSQPTTEMPTGLSSRGRYIQNAPLPTLILKTFASGIAKMCKLGYDWALRSCMQPEFDESFGDRVYWATRNAPQPSLTRGTRRQYIDERSHVMLNQTNSETTPYFPTLQGNLAEMSFGFTQPTSDNWSTATSQQPTLDRNDLSVQASVRNDTRKVEGGLTVSTTNRLQANRAKKLTKMECLEALVKASPSENSAALIDKEAKSFARDCHLCSPYWRDNNPLLSLIGGQGKQGIDHAYQMLATRFFSPERLLSLEGIKWLSELLKQLSPSVQETLQRACSEACKKNNLSSPDQWFNLLNHANILSFDIKDQTTAKIKFFMDNETTLQDIQVNRDTFLIHLKQIAHHLLALDKDEQTQWLNSNSSQRQLRKDCVLDLLTKYDPNPDAYLLPSVTQLDRKSLSNYQAAFLDVFSKNNEEPVLHWMYEYARDPIAAKQTVDRLISKIDKFFSTEDQNEIDYQDTCRSKFKFWFSNEERIDILCILLTQIMHDPKHPMQEPLKQSLKQPLKDLLDDQLNADDFLHRCLEQVKTSPPPLFRSAFNNRYVLARWREIAELDNAESHSLRDQLKDYSQKTLSPTLKSFLDLSLSPPSKDANPESKNKQLLDSLNQLTAYDWKALQSLIPGDKKLLRTLHTSYNDDPDTVNLLALHLIANRKEGQTHADRIFELIDGHPEFRKNTERLLKDGLNLGKNLSDDLAQNIEKMEPMYQQN